MRPFLVGLVLVLAAACGPGGDDDGQAVAPAAVTVSPAFNGTDAAWLQIMIPMTRHVVDALALAPENAGDPGLRSLAASVLAEHRADLDRLEGLRVAAGLPDTDVHAGHRMPGMVTEADLVVLRAAHGADFDAHLRPLLDKHLAQCGVLASGELANGQQAEVKTLAKAVQAVRAHELDRLRKLG